MQQAIQIAEEIASDNTSGSSIIVDKIIALLNLCQYGRFGHLTKDQLRQIVEVLKKIDNSLRIVHHFLHHYEISLDAAGDDFYSYIGEYYEKWKDVNHQIAHNLSQLVSLENKKILLHSNSGTVLQALKLLHADGVNFSVIQTESRPMMEGREEAQKLSMLGIKVDFICDAAVGTEVNNADICLLGADVFTATEFVNKIGSAAICQAANYYNKPVFVACDSRKWIDNLDHVKLLNPAKELWGEDDPNINIKNYYFETIPRDLTNSIVHE